MTNPWDRREPAERRRDLARAMGDWLPAATTFSPYWADRAEDVTGKSGAALSDLDGLRRLAPVRERDLIGLGGPGAPDLVLRPDEEQFMARARGGLVMAAARAIGAEGSQGKQRTLLTEYKPIHLHRGGADGDLGIAYTRSDLDRLHRCGARAASLLGLDAGNYLLSAVPAGPTLAFWGVYHLALGASMLAVHPRGAGARPTEVLDALRLLPADVVAVPVDEAAELGTLAADLGAPCEDVATIVTVGPPPEDAVRRDIAGAWERATGGAVVVRALWAPPSARALWAECRGGTHGLHTYPDLEHLEVVDPVTGAPAEEGGDLTATSLGWHGTALLRYRTGTRIGGLATGPCPACGRTLPRLVGEVTPRAWQPRVDLGDEVARIDLRGAAAVLEQRGDVEGWRVKLAAGQDSDRILIAIAGAPAAGDAGTLVRDLADATGVWPTEVDHVPDPALLRAGGDGWFVDERPGWR